MKKLLLLWAPLLIISACATTQSYHREEIVYADGKIQKFAYVDDTQGKKNPGSGAFLEAVDIIRKYDNGALPELKDLPVPPEMDRKKKVRRYTGLIQNYTRYDVAIPSANSGSALTVPAQGWIEYTAWTPKVDLDGYVDGKLVYHQRVTARPHKLKYMGKYYDFLAEIKPPEPQEKPAPKSKPKGKKKQAVG